MNIKSIRATEWNKANNERRKEIQKRYREKNHEKVLAGKKVWRDNNKEYILMKFNEKMKSDPLFKLKNNISALIRGGMKYKGYKKNCRTTKIIGCTIDEFRIHLESLFEPWMNWNNYGIYIKDNFNVGWDIDHIIPINSANSEEDIIKLNHYSNLRPLCSKINRDVKRAKAA